jgi:ATP-binding cassette subfamily G (WHITE) protein 1
MLAYWAGSGWGLFMSVFIPKMEVATALAPVILIPLMVLGGFFMNTSDTPKCFYPIIYISMFRYAY